MSYLTLCDSIFVHSWPQHKSSFKLVVCNRLYSVQNFNMEAILSYDSDESDKSDKSDAGNTVATDLFAHLKPVDTTNSVSKTIALNSTPVAIPTASLANFLFLHTFLKINTFVYVCVINAQISFCCCCFLMFVSKT